MMARLYLILILIGILIALFFSEITFLFEPKTLIFFNREITVTGQILFSGLTTLILTIILLIGLIEKVILLLSKKSKAEKKKEVSIKE
jgi:hypothetical protein|tara:strand:+ start:190 stop:453 length:264 start_codon:yes stop_codon:yes gene_type:complete